MTAEARAGGKSEFEIQAAPAPQIFETRSGKRLLQKVEAQPVVPKLCDGEATTVDGDTVAEPHFSGELRRRNFEPFLIMTEVERYDRANFLDEAGEHFSRIAVMFREASRLSKEQERDE